MFPQTYLNLECNLCFHTARQNVLKKRQHLACITELVKLAKYGYAQRLETKVRNLSKDCSEINSVSVHKVLSLS